MKYQNFGGCRLAGLIVFYEKEISISLFTAEIFQNGTVYQ